MGSNVLALRHTGHKNSKEVGLFSDLRLGGFCQFDFSESHQCYTPKKKSISCLNNNKPVLKTHFFLKLNKIEGFHFVPSEFYPGNWCTWIIFAISCRNPNRNHGWVSGNPSQDVFYFSLEILFFTICLWKV